MTDGVVTHISETTLYKRQKGKFWSSNNPWLWLSPALIYLVIFSAAPLLYNVWISLNEWKTRKKVFEFVGLQNWIDLVLHDDRFRNALLVTLQYVIIALIIQVILGLLIALLLDARPWGVTIMQALIILPMVTAPMVAGMLFRLLTHPNFGLISYLSYKSGLLTEAEPLIGGTGRYALIGVLLVEIWQWTPFFVLIILSGLKGLSSEVLEAAEVDGANWWQRLLRVKIPMLRGVLTIAILFRLVDLYKVFDYIVVLTSGGPGTATETVSYYGYTFFTKVNYGMASTVGLFVMIVAWITAFGYIKIFKVRW